MKFLCLEDLKKRLWKFLLGMGRKEEDAIKTGKGES